MPEPMSTHIPSMSGAIESITGSLVVDTGLRNVQTFVASLNASAVAANEESIVHWSLNTLVGGETQKVTIYVKKGGTNHGDAGDSAVNVSWLALGK